MKNCLKDKCTAPIFERAEITFLELKLNFFSVVQIIPDSTFFVECF